MLGRAQALVPDVVISTPSTSSAGSKEAVLVESEVLVEEGQQESSNERGATLVLASAVLVVLIGMAGFAVDLGWLYSQRTEATKAAESAALAGVIHMPNPTSQAWGPGAEAFDVARDIAERKGYEHGANAVVTPLEIAGHPNRLRVDVSRPVETFFMRVFGVDSVQIDSSATAEQTPPLKIGSDEPNLGGVSDDFFIAINGTRRGKGSGDPYATKCLGTAHDCGSLENTIEYRRPAYYYAVEVPPSEVGGSLSVEIYDGNHRNRALGTETSEYGATGPVDISFRLFAPDSTPAEPSDNSNVVCSRTFTDTTDDLQLNRWQPLDSCPVLAELGVYVLEVDIIEQTPNPAANTFNHPVSAFAIRSKIDGNPDNDTAVFGLGSMSLWMPNTGTAPEFKIVKLEPFYAGTELILSLFDPGDLNGTGTLDIIGELAGTECEVRVRNADGSVKSNWSPDDGGSNCRLVVSNKEYNNEWLDLRFDIPPTYTCGSDCWVNVRFAFSSTVFERTTWTATINGLPVHLVP